MTKSLTKRFFKSFDYFGVQFNFHYKSREKYHSATGGVIFLGFVVLTLTYVSINIVSFIKRKNFSIIYYTTRLSETDEISFLNYSTNYAFGISCGGSTPQEQIEEMLKVKINHITRITKEGESKKETKQMTLRHCQYSDFFNEFNETFDDNGFNELYCIAEQNNSVQGIYSDEVFKYYEISISSGIDTEDNFKELNTLLQNDECDFNIYFVDVAVDLYDYKKPIKRFINTNFVALKADEYVKMNLDFQTQKFDSYENYLFDTHHSEYYVGFAGFERYSIFKGTNRYEVKPYDYDKYSKIYLRASLQRNIIQRKYMKLTEFAADMSSILSQILLFLFISVSFINRFYANQSVMKKIFQFKDYKNKNNILKTEFKKHLQEIDSQMNTPTNTNDEYTWEHLTNNKQTHKRYSVITNTNSAHNTGGFNIIKYGKSSHPSSDDIFEYGSKKVNVMSSKRTDASNVTPTSTTNIRPNSSANSPFTMNTKYVNIITNKSKTEKITLQYSIIELLFVFVCPCCAWKKLRMKNILLAKARKKLYFQLDILTYLKNMQLLELLNFILLDPKENIILKVLSKPSISLVNRIDIYDQLHLKYNVDINDEEMNQFYGAMKLLHDKKNRTPIEGRLFKIASVEMQNLFNSSKHVNNNNVII